MYRYPKLPFYESFGAIPSSYLISLSYEEQILWLCHQVQAIKEGTPNYNYELLENKPSINHIPLIGDVTLQQLGVNFNYNDLTNKPFINGQVVAGSKSLDEYGIQAKLIAGDGISISGNVISAIGGGGGSGTSNYELLSNKPSINNVTLQGSLDSKDLGLQNTLEVDLTPNAQTNTIYVINGLQEGDYLPECYLDDLKGSESFATSIVIPVLRGEHYDIEGAYDLIKTSENLVAVIYSTNGENDSGYFEASSDGLLILSFHNINTFEPKITKIMTGEGLNSEEELELKVSTRTDNNLQTLLNTNYHYETPTLESEKIYYIDQYNKLDQSSRENAKCYLIDIDQNPINNVVKLQGFCHGSPDRYMILYADSDSNVIGWEERNLGFAELTDFSLTIPKGTTYIAFNFKGTNVNPAELQIMRITTLAVTHLSNNITLTAGNLLNLETGIYNTGEYRIYFHSTTSSNLMYGQNELIYFNIDEQRFTGTFKSVYYDGLEADWAIQENEALDTTLTNSRNKIPTSEAVYNAIQSGGGADVFYTTIDENVTLNADGTSTYNFENGKYYYLAPNRSITYYNSSNTAASGTIYFGESIFYYEEDYSGDTLLQKLLYRTGINRDIAEVSNAIMVWTPENNYWYLDHRNYRNYVQNYNHSLPVSTRNSIPSTGNNNDVPTINAVRNYVADQNINQLTYIQEKLTNGSPSDKSANAWQQWGSILTTTNDIPSGAYLLAITYAATSKANINISSVCTIRASIEESGTYTEITGARGTIPLPPSTGATCSASALTTIQIPSEGKYKFKFEGYGTQTWQDGYSIVLNFIRIGDYVAPTP